MISYQMNMKDINQLRDFTTLLGVLKGGCFKDGDTSLIFYIYIYMGFL